MIGTRNINGREQNSKRTSVFEFGRNLLRARETVSPVSGGHLNRCTGWILLIAAFGYAAWLDPWSFTERDLSAQAGHLRIAVRHAHIMVMGMAFLQIATSWLITTPSLSLLARRGSAWLTGSGAVIYAAGYALTTRSESGALLITAGALISLAGFMVVFWGVPGWRGNREVSVALPIICFGMLLEAVVGLFESSPELFLSTYLGPNDGLPLRMLRLGRVAIIVLSVLTLLYQGLADKADPRGRAVRWGRVAMLCGTILMPSILAAASLTCGQANVLLPIAANAVFVGTLCGVYLARRHAGLLELWGWLLIALSMSSGLLMGLYAFDGPLPPPNFIGTYNDFGRRLIRLAHTYGIVFGLLSIFISRDGEVRGCSIWSSWIGQPLLVGGSVTTVAVILLLAGIDLPPGVLAMGPSLVTMATVLCIGPVATRPNPVLTVNRAYRFRREVGERIAAESSWEVSK